MRPANTTTTTFVVWDPNILAQVGIVPQMTAGELVQQEGVPGQSLSEIAAWEAAPGLKIWQEPEKWARELEVTGAPPGSGLGMPVTDVPSKEPTSTRVAPKQRPTGEEGPISW